jgi:hypothetical protein
MYSPSCTPPSEGYVQRSTCRQLSTATVWSRPRFSVSGRHRACAIFSGVIFLQRGGRGRGSRVRVADTRDGAGSLGWLGAPLGVDGQQPASASVSGAGDSSGSVRGSVVGRAEREGAFAEVEDGVSPAADRVSLVGGDAGREIERRARRVLQHKCDAHRPWLAPVHEPVVGAELMVDLDELAGRGKVGLAP